MQTTTSSNQVRETIVPLDPSRKVSPHWTIQRKRRQIRNAVLIAFACMVLVSALGAAIYLLT